MWCCSFLVPCFWPKTWLEKTEERAAKSVWDVLRYRIHKKKLLIFSGTLSPSFCIVCDCFDHFRTNLPKIIGRFHRKQNTKFPKRPWVRSKKVFLSAALLFSLVVTKWIFLRTSSDLSTWNNTCFLFKCRVTFWLRYFSNATFGTLALCILRLRCLATPNTYKRSFWFFSETWSSSFCSVCNCFDDFRTNLPKNNGPSHRKENTNFPKWRWVRSRNVCLSSALLFPLVVTK